tara:strand:- start:50681 stop:51289 length:609 start_codon:yes stop_codon:yes gene_type:complete
VGLKTARISISQGELKGRSFPLPPAVAGHRHFTPALLKDAAFQLLENSLEPGPFWDLCAGSGQMAMEALSRGYDPVHLVELDRQRFQWLKNRVCSGYSVQLHNKDFLRVAPLILAVQKSNSVCFVDLPYSFWGRDGSCEKLESFLESLRKHQEGRPLPYILVQAPMVWKIRTESVLSWKEEMYSQEQRDYRGQKLIMLTPNS